MNRYFGTMRGKNPGDREKNIALASIRSAIIRNRSMLFATSRIDYWYKIISNEFPNVNIRKDDGGIYVNERNK